MRPFLYQNPGWLVALSALALLPGKAAAAECTAPNGENMTLSDDTVMDTQIYEVCDTIVVGPNYMVRGPDGNLSLTAATVILETGASVGVDGTLTIDTVLPPGNGSGLPAQDRSALVSVYSSFEQQTAEGFVDELNSGCIWRSNSTVDQTVADPYVGGFAAFFPSGGSSWLELEGSDCPEIQGAGSFVAFAAVRRAAGDMMENNTVFRTGPGTSMLQLMLRGQSGCNESGGPASCARCYTHATGSPNLADVLRSDSSESLFPNGDWQTVAWDYDSSDGTCDIYLEGAEKTIHRQPKTNRTGVPATAFLDVSESERGLDGASIDNAGIAFGSKADQLTPEDICAIQSLGLKGKLGWCEDNGVSYRECPGGDVDCGGRAGACDLGASPPRCIGRNRTHASSCQLPACAPGG